MLHIAYTGALSAWLDKIKNSFKSASINGTTITLTKNDDSTITLTTQDTTYSDATTNSSGLMSAQDKATLDGLTTVLSGGTSGQVLAKTANGYAWTDLVEVLVNPSVD